MRSTVRHRHGKLAGHVTALQSSCYAPLLCDVKFLDAPKPQCLKHRIEVATQTDAQAKRESKENIKKLREPIKKDQGTDPQPCDLPIIGQMVSHDQAVPQPCKPSRNRSRASAVHRFVDRRGGTSAVPLRSAGLWTQKSNPLQDVFALWRQASSRSSEKAPSA